ncbi:hypothetical protein OGATHE_006311 [Ogataea polymorpha]|uniref:Uncharacterized protein n=1 Tax=Ogataea polymorpha TaxID=460523 RepID=A0A9P8NUH2_9ASCO|nr:hypothetical protein OGATHE_006311 [Ogataea polymorpha]
MVGLLSRPTFDVVCLGSCPSIKVCDEIDLNASITTLPFTDWIGSITTATERGFNCSKDCCVLTSTDESQHPKPGCEWYHPTTI